jgi:iron complex transport system ATP-binding protein
MKVQIDGLWFDYADVKVIEDLRFTVAKEFVGIVGPNGCGKTTLLKLMSRILVPNRGVILVDGKDIQDLGPKEIGRNISLLPQDTPIDFAFTAMEVVLMGRNPYLDRLQSSSQRDLDIVEEAMKQTRTWHLRERDVTELSGGEKQKVLIARALAQEPNILLLDEPTLHLDIGAQLEILELLRKLNRERGIAVVAVMHDLNIAARYCSKLLLIQEGRILSAGLPEEVLTRENIRLVYGVDVKIETKPDIDSIHIYPLSRKAIDDNEAINDDARNDKI